MAEQTGIEWCDATFNPWWGCDRVSPACAHCYADALAIRYGHRIWGADHDFRFFGDKHWAEPLKWARSLPAKLGRRPRVFCASMADVFEERAELDEHRIRLFDLIAETPELDWLVLTKRPEFARDWLREFYFDRVSMLSFPGLPNMWVGVSIENSRYTWRADVLREIPAAVRFISAEPLLGSLFVPSFGAVLRRGEARTVQPPSRDGVPLSGREPGSGIGAGQVRSELATARERSSLNLTGIDWVIVGGESGPKARPFHLEHARELLYECDRDGYRRSIGESSPLSVFVKQLGANPIDSASPLKLNDRKGGDWGEWPADLRIREFPTNAAVVA